MGGRKTIQSVDIARLKEQYSPEMVAERYALDLHRAGGRIVYACPFHDDPSPSFTVYPDHFFCFGCQWHGDVLDFVAGMEGLELPKELPKAAEILSGEQPIDPSPSIGHSVPRGTVVELAPVMPVPKRASDIKAGVKTPPIFNATKGKAASWSAPTAVYRYLDYNGAFMGVVLRAEFGGKKITPQIMWCEWGEGKRGWALQTFPAPRPLYHPPRGSNEIDQRTLPVLVVEGEKAADAAQELLGEVYEVVTWPGGGHGVNLAAWELLEGRSVLLWPDADEPGYKAMGKLGAILERMEPGPADVRVVATMQDPAPAAGWDLADEPNWTADQAIKWARPRAYNWEEGSALLQLPMEAEELVDGPATEREQAEPQEVITEEPQAPTDLTREEQLAWLKERIWQEVPGKKEKTVNVAILALYVRVKHWVKVGPGGALYRYDPLTGLYLDDGKRRVDQAVREILGTATRQVHMNEVLANLQRSYPIEIHPDAEPDPDYIMVANGRLNWRTDELLPFDPEYIALAGLPVEWHADAKCPRIEQFFMEVLPHDAIDLVLEMFAQAIAPHNQYQRIFVLIGSGGNGKSRLLNVLIAFLGKRNVSTLSLEQITNDRFAGAQLHGKLANVCGDLDKASLRYSDTLKKMSGGDRMSVQKKYENSFDMECRATGIFAANAAPRSKDQSQALFDRWVPVPMEKRFRGDENKEIPQVKLDAILTAKGELEGLLVLVVEAMQRLDERGRFEIPPSVKKRMEQFRDEVDTVQAFIRACCRVEKQGRVVRTVLFKAYQEHCQDEGSHPLKAGNFYSQLLENRTWQGKIKEGRIGADGKRGFHGLHLIPEILRDIQAEQAQGNEPAEAPTTDAEDGPENDEQGDLGF